MPSVTTLFTDPEEFFRERADDPSLKGPIAIMALIAFVNAFKNVIQFRALFGILQSSGIESELVSTVMTGIAAFSFVFVLAGPFVTWLMWTGGFALVAVFLDGSNDFSKTLRLAGWGFVPQVFASVVTLGLTYYRYEIQGLSTPGNLTEENAQEWSQEFAQLQGEFAATSVGVSIFFTLVSAYIWFYAVQYALDLDRRDAAITVAVPLLISILWNAQTLFTSYSTFG